MAIIDEIFHLFATQGHQLYFGEAVSENEHALQSAFQAEQADESDAMVVAALLHDIGHLLHGLTEDIATRGVDGRHEHAGHAWLYKHFGPEVTQPIKLHVAAKRYLSAVEPGYHAGLSPMSQRSLQLQGGVFTPAELADFEMETFYQEALRLRRYDDRAKIVGLAVPDLDHYRDRLNKLVTSSHSM